MKTTIRFVLLACSMLFSGCMDMVFTEQNLRDGGYLESWSPKDGSVTKGIVYDAKKNLKYGLYVPNSHHGMWDDPQATRKFKAAVLAYCKRYMR